MGEVYCAEDTKLKRLIALKRLAPDLRADSRYRRRFLEEAAQASRFSDAHIAALYDVLEEQNEMYLVMEYVDGQTLRQRLLQPLSLEQFFDIATQCGWTPAGVSNTACRSNRVVFADDVEHT